MKGFIEVTLLIGGSKIAYKLKHVKAFKDNGIVLKEDSWVGVKQSYEEIKKLIKEAQ